MLLNKSKNYVLPGEILLNEALSIVDIRLYLYVIAKGDSYTGCAQDVEEIATVLKMSIRTIYRSLRKLEDQNVIKRLVTKSRQVFAKQNY